jgi:hypothetical protein
MRNDQSGARTRTHSESFAKQKQASRRVSHEVLLECDAFSHRFHSPGALGIDHLINNPRQR